MARRRGIAAAGILLLVVAFAAASVSAQSADVDAAAAQEVASLKDALHQAEQRATGLQTAYEQEKGKAEAAQAQLNELAAKADAAVREAAELRAAKSAAETAAATAQKAQQEPTVWCRRARGGRSANPAFPQAAEAQREELVQQLAAAKDSASKLATAQAELAAAQASLAKAEADLKTMEARVDESQKLADSLLAQHYEEWVPHWVADGYERRVRPTAVAAWETTSETGRTLYRSSSAQASQLWAVASPTVQTYTDATKKYAWDTHQKVVKHPHIAALKRKYEEAKHNFLNLKPVKVLAAHAGRTQAELEAVFGKFLRAHPLLAPLGDKKTVKYVVWGVLVAPLLALLLPLALLPKRPKAQPAGSSSGGGRGSASKAKKGRRITMGGDTVSFA